MSFVLAVCAAGNVSAEELGDYYVIEDFEVYSTSPAMKLYWDDTGSVLDYYSLNLDYPYSGLKCVGINYYTFE